MENYIDAFVLPIPKKHLEEYQQIAAQVAEIWKEHGALSYHEYVGDDLVLEGTRSFPACLDANEDEAIIFGWVVFASRETRDLANQKVPSDPRMSALISPLVDPTRIIFDAQKMVYGGFRSLV